MNPRDSMPSTTSAAPRYRSAIRSITCANARAFLSSGVMSRNMIPGLGKSGISRTRVFSSSMVICFRLQRVPRGVRCDGACKNTRGSVKEQFGRLEDAKARPKASKAPEKTSLMFRTALFFPGLQLAQVVIEAVETFLPEAPVALQPLGGILEGCRLKSARAPLGFAAARDKTGPLQHLKMLGNRGHAHLEWLREFGHRKFAQRQTCKNRSPGGIGERGKGVAQSVRRHQFTNLVTR